MALPRISPRFPGLPSCGAAPTSVAVCVGRSTVAADKVLNRTPLFFPLKHCQAPARAASQIQEVRAAPLAMSCALTKHIAVTQVEACRLGYAQRPRLWEPHRWHEQNVRQNVHRSANTRSMVRPTNGKVQLTSAGLHFLLPYRADEGDVHVNSVTKVGLKQDSHLSRGGIYPDNSVSLSRCSAAGSAAGPVGNDRVARRQKSSVTKP